MSKFFDKKIFEERLKSEQFREIDDLRVDLNNYFIEQFGYKRPPCVYPDMPPLIFHRDAFKLYLRYYKAPQYDGMLLVIARAKFKKTKAGHMTRFLGYIVQISERYNITNVAIEQALSDNGVASAKSFGFHNSFDERNWIISIEELRNNLSKRKI
jgi:hypothetical protein